MTRADRAQDERALRCPYCDGALVIDCEYVGRAYLAENRPESITCGDCDARWEPDGTFREPARWVSFPDLYHPPATTEDVGPAHGVHEVSATLLSARPSEPDDEEDTMRLGEPRVRTQATHSINVAVEDGPILDSPGHYRGQRDRRFQVRMLRIRYVDGLLTSVEVDGPILNADGTPNGRGSSASIDYETREGGALREDTPDWVREVVEAHPWPGSLATLAETPVAVLMAEVGRRTAEIMSEGN